MFKNYPYSVKLFNNNIFFFLTIA